MVLAAFLVGLAAVLAATLYAVVQGVGLWRQTKQYGRTLAAELALFEERAERTERLLAEAERASERLAAAQERLRISRARLRVLTGSLEVAQRRTRWLRAFLPLR
jgi:hypothetical protein